MSVKLLFRSLLARSQSIQNRLAARAGVKAERESAYREYRQACKTLGIDRLYLFLSFDCDTDFDIPVIAPLNKYLSERGIVATYAVPGTQLIRGRDEYGALARSGVEFMNHGARPHAKWEDDRYVPVTFYQEMPENEIVADIEGGHEIVCDVTGQIPVGFRAPHFGGFQSKENLDLIYRTIASLGYRYASTTNPDKGLARGPAYRERKIIEFPIFGSVRNPAIILDSWTHLTDRHRYALGSHYFELFAETIDWLVAEKMPGILTWYVDPSHVWQQKPFDDAIDLIARHDIASLGGQALAARMNASLTDQSDI